MRLAIKTKDTCEVGSSSCDVASDFLSLTREETLVPMACFLLGFCKVFWKTHFIIVEQHDSIAQKSGQTARDVSVQLCTMRKELNALEASYKHNDEFLPNFNRKVCT